MNTLRNSLKIVAIAASLIAALTFASCNTVSGVGKDVQSAGTALENAGSR